LSICIVFIDHSISLPFSRDLHGKEQSIEAFNMNRRRLPPDSRVQRIEVFIVFNFSIPFSAFLIGV